MSATVHPVDQRLPRSRLAALGLQPVLVLHAGAVAEPPIIGRALKPAPEQVAIQSLGLGRHFGVRLPVTMGVSFAAHGGRAGEGASIAPAKATKAR